MANGRRGANVALIVAVVAIALSVGAVAVRVASPTSGGTIGGRGFLVDGVEVAVLPGATTSLRDGDVVTAMAGRSVVSWVDDIGRLGGSATTAGDIVRFDVVRAGQPVPLDVHLLSYPTLDVLAASWGTLAFVLALLGVGVFVFWKRPTEPAAAALLLAGVGAAGSTVPFLLGQDPIDFVGGSFLVGWTTTTFVYLLLYAGMIDFGLTFPRPLAVVARRPRLRLVAYAAVFGGYVAGVGLAALGATNTLAWIGAWVPLQLLPVAAAFVLVPIALVLHWRHGPVEDRKLLRAFSYVLALVIAAALVVWVIPEALGGAPLVPWTVAGLVGLPLPLIIATSIVRYRAFDIDVVVRRSLVYGGLTVGVIATYGLTAALLGALLGGLSPFATSLVSTGLAAIVALPMRDGLQRIVTRLLYGDREEPVRAIRRLGERLELSVDPEAMPRIVVDTVADALRLPYVAFELGVPPTARLVAERGPRPGDTIARPLVFRSRTVGRLLVGPRGPTDPLSASDLRLLDDLTRQVGVAAHAALLTEDLRTSRERIVAAREEERRRLRRDLHDGLGPALAAIGMRAEAAEGLVATDPEASERLLAELRHEVAAAVVDIRRLVDGLRPPAIDDLGLVGALRLAADGLTGAGPTRVSIVSDDTLPELPAAVEVAAYRIASEAMTNAVRHAAAATCSVRLVGGDDLVVTVEDDGRGLPAERRDGVGLPSMQERAAELGGECSVEPGPTGGTRVVARLPLLLDARAEA